MTVAILTMLLTACDPAGSGTESGAQGAPTPPRRAAARAGGGDEPAPGGQVRIAFSAPGADHGWLAAITDNAREAAEANDDVEFIILEGTNDSATQVTQVEQLIAEGPDALVILPHEGDVLTPVALQAMEQGIPVVNVDREFSTPAAYRTWIGGDNYGIGTAAARFIAEGGLYRATFLYNPSMAAWAVNLARLIALGDGMSEFAEPEVPSRIQVPATTVTPDNVEEVSHLGF